MTHIKKKYKVRNDNNALSTLKSKLDRKQEGFFFLFRNIKEPAQRQEKMGNRKITSTMKVMTRNTRFFF